MSLIDRVFMRFDEFKWAQIKRRALFQSTTNRAISFRNPENSREKPTIPTFGADPSGFGEDWASYRLPKRRPVGPLPIEHENTHGYINPNSERPIEPSEPYEDPAISSRGSRTSEGTDQKAPIGHGVTPADRPITLHTGSRKCLESDTGKGSKEPTLGDRAARDLKKWDFDFSV